MTSLNPSETIQADFISRSDLLRVEAALRAQALLHSLFGPTTIPEQTQAAVCPQTIDPVDVGEVDTKPDPPRDIVRPKPPRQPRKLRIVRPPVEKLILPRVPLGDSTRLGFDESMPGLYDDDDIDWQAQALCAQVDPEIFFPEKGGSTREAKKICLNCEVKDKCLEYALDRDERFGIWGGKSERERRRIKRGQAVVSDEVVAVSPPYSRVKQLVDILNGSDDENEWREQIENTLHEDEQRLTKFVQSTLGRYKAGLGSKLGKGELDRLFRYFTGDKLWTICESANPQTRLGREIQLMTDFFDELAEGGVDPLMMIWDNSASTESPLGVLNHVEPKPVWQKEAMLAHRRAATAGKIAVKKELITV